MSTPITFRFWTANTTWRWRQKQVKEKAVDVFLISLLCCSGASFGEVRTVWQGHWKVAEAEGCECGRAFWGPLRGLMGCLHATCWTFLASMFTQTTSGMEGRNEFSSVENSQLKNPCVFLHQATSSWCHVQYAFQFTVKQNNKTTKTELSFFLFLIIPSYSNFTNSVNLYNTSESETYKKSAGNIKKRKTQNNKHHS